MPAERNILNVKTCLVTHLCFVNGSDEMMQYEMCE